MKKPSLLKTGSYSFGGNLTGLPVTLRGYHFVKPYGAFTNLTGLGFFVFKALRGFYQPYGAGLFLLLV